jgi:predicted nucleic acid-binding protein
VRVAPIGDADVPRLDELMDRYHDRPMDFADATLVHLAQRESMSTIFTVDNDDFETYRIDGRRRFRVLPGRNGP